MSRPLARSAALCSLLTPILVVHAQTPDEHPQVVVATNFTNKYLGVMMTQEDLSKATFTTDVKDTVDGTGRSLKGDSRASTAEWNEFFHSRADLFAPREAYKVSFDYRVLARDKDANFYTLFRRAGMTNTEGWQEWKGEPGATSASAPNAPASGHVETTFATGDAANFVWIIGIHGKGALAIDHLVIQTDPANRPLPPVPPPPLPTPARTWKSPGGTTYYVDSVSGDDGRDGVSEKGAWRSLDRVNSGSFAGGDRILLRCGGAWEGFLAPGGSGGGKAGKPIVVGNYGAGAKPRLDARGKWLATVYLVNAEQIEVGGLDVANTAPRPTPWLAGVEVQEIDFGVAHHVVLRGLDVHNVNGSNVKDAGGGTGIVCNSGGAKVPTAYDDLRIEGCHLTHTDRNGIGVNGNWARKDWFPSRRVVIRSNLLEDIGGDGIVPIGCDGALVERNVLKGGRMRAQDYAAGIWPWSCDNTVVQYNEVSGMRGTKDGEGFDSDYNCQNTLFQFNYSHDNDGGFMLICTDGAQHMPYIIGNLNTVIRDNVSRNDGLHTFNFAGPVQNNLIERNTFYIGETQDVQLVASGNWGNAWADKTRFRDNTFIVAGKAGFDFGKMTDTVFDNNRYYGNITGRPADAHATVGKLTDAPRVPATVTKK